MRTETSSIFQIWRRACVHSFSNFTTILVHACCETEWLGMLKESWPDINKSNFNRNLHLGTTIYRVVRWLALVSVNFHPGIMSLSENDWPSQKNSRFDKGVSDLPDICVAPPAVVSRLELVVRERPTIQILALLQRLGPNRNPWVGVWVQDRGGDATTTIS